jgi:hypothetical protein
MIFTLGPIKKTKLYPLRVSNQAPPHNTNLNIATTTPVGK